MTRPTYPPTATVDQVDDYHGTPVADPYRWLEDTEAADTRTWIEAQNALTFDFLGRIPARDRLRRRLTELWNYQRVSVPIKRGERYFQFRNTGLQNQDVMYGLDGLEDEPRLLLDPNTLSTDGTVALNTWSVSPDGRRLAYAVSASGSDWVTWRVRDVDTGQDLADQVEWSKFSGASWLKDNSGFYYTRYDAPTAGQDYTGANYYHKIYLHRLGEAQAQDQLVYERPDQKEWGFGTYVSDDGRYLIVNVWQGTDVRNRLFYQNLESGEPMVELIADLTANYSFVGNDGPVFYLYTNLNAPLGRVIAVDITQPDPANWRTLIAEAKDNLESIRLVHDQFIGLYLHHAHHRLKRFDLQGNFLGDISLPAFGSITAMAGRREDDLLFFATQSFLYPTTIFRYDFVQTEPEVFSQIDFDFDATTFVTRQVFVTSKDGTRVPMFLTHRRDLVLDGSTPTLLYGYGGFNISLTPKFTVTYLAWLEMGGAVAWANLRGGGEYGETWHEAGMKDRKQNVFDDFIACAEYLIAERITSTPRLAIMGGSNGGLLVGACMTQRPDLFGAAVPAVGVMDMLRFQHFTIGWAWTSDFGSSDDPDQFQTLYAYSPLHNLKPGTAYPPTLVLTGDHDDRVVPGHSFKFAAALQAAQAGAAPTLIRIQTKAGHGLGKPTSILIEESADLYAFLVEVLDME